MRDISHSGDPAEDGELGRALPAEPWPRGCVQVYTGDGKGKTTAALGLAIRAAGRGLPVFIGQFMKGIPYGEVVALARFEEIRVEQFGGLECIPWSDAPAAEDVRRAGAGLARLTEILERGEHRVVIADEVNVAIFFKLLTERSVLELLDRRPAGVELVCTGRYAPPALIARADLVSEVHCRAHPYETSGLAARDGIER